MAGKRKRTSLRRKQLRGVRRKLSFGKRKAVRNIARKVFDKNTETKCLVLQQTESTCSTLQSASFVTRLFEPQQGDESHQRHGRQVLLTGMHMKLNLHHNGNRPVYVRVLIIQTKLQTPLDNNSEFYLGPDNNVNTLSQPFGTARVTCPINKWKYWPVYDKTIKLDGREYSDQHHMFKSMRLMTIKKKFRKKIWFDENAATGSTGEQGPDNQSMHYYLVIIPADGANDTAIGETVEVSFYNTMYFKDA